MCALRNGKNYEGNGLSDTSETFVNILYKIHKRIFVTFTFQNFSAVWKVKTQLSNKSCKRSKNGSHKHETESCHFLIDTEKGKNISYVISNVGDLNKFNVWWTFRDLTVNIRQVSKCQCCCLLENVKCDYPWRLVDPTSTGRPPRPEILYVQ